MPDPLLEEYKEYYRVRASRFANNPHYENSFAAETELSNAMQSCDELVQFKDRIGNLNEKCANALVKDEYLIEQAWFNKHEEKIRVLAADRIIARVDDMQNVQDLVTMVGEISNEVSILISMDEANRQFQYDWGEMDKAEIYENAEVPSEYRDKLKSWAEEIRDNIVKGVGELEKENSKWQDGWRYTPEINLEHRHRRLLAYSDEHIKERLAEYRKLVNR